jgi:hypothetical protein
MEAVNISETSVTPTRLHGATSQKTLSFMSSPIGVNLYFASEYSYNCKINVCTLLKAGKRWPSSSIYVSESVLSKHRSKVLPCTGPSRIGDTILIPENERITCNE